MVLCDSEGTEVKKITLRMLSQAHLLSQGGCTSVLAFGDVDVSVLKSHGADKIYLVKGDDFHVNNTGSVLSCLQK